MSRFVATSVKKLTDEEGQATVVFNVATQSKYAANVAVEEMKRTDKNLVVDVKPYKSKRSLEQNRLLWELLGKLAEATSGEKNKETVDEIYMSMIEEANITCEYLMALPSAEEFLKDSFRVVRKIGERTVNGKVLNMYKCFIGSSHFDTKEMTTLIETVLHRLSELGIYDSVIELANGEYL